MSSGGHSLESYYDEWFKLYYHCKMTFDQYENLLPFERDIFIGMWNNQREEEERDSKRNNNVSDVPDNLMEQ